MTEQSKNLNPTQQMVKLISQRLAKQLLRDNNLPIQKEESTKPSTQQSTESKEQKKKN